MNPACGRERWRRAPRFMPSAPTSRDAKRTRDALHHRIEWTLFLLLHPVHQEESLYSTSIPSINRRKKKCYAQHLRHRTAGSLVVRQRRKGNKGSPVHSIPSSNGAKEHRDKGNSTVLTPRAVAGRRFLSSPPSRTEEQAVIVNRGQQQAVTNPNGTVQPRRSNAARRGKRPPPAPPSRHIMKFLPHRTLPGRTSGRKPGEELNGSTAFMNRTMKNTAVTAKAQSKEGAVHPWQVAGRRVRPPGNHPLRPASY